MELRELVSQMREAMEDGYYGLAVAACEHMLETYPASLVAHRMLGEALVEQGAFDAADEHFRRVLSIDPLNPVAHLGLGVAAEERNDADAAYAHYLNAWEMHPELDHLRDELVRLRAVSDEDPRLHPTRSALAALFARGGQTRRAVAEWRSVIADEPANTSARLALAELLWRTGDDSGALTASREVLEHLPDCARALAIIADIERREDGETLPERIDHYRSLDPSGEIALELGSVAAGRDVGFLIEDTVHMPDFNAAEGDLPVDVAVAAGENQESVTGTNASEGDPWAGLIREISGDTDGPHEGREATAVPFSWDDMGTGPGDDDSDPLTAQVEAARPPGVESDAQQSGEDLGLLSDVDLVDPSIQPFNFEDEAGSNATDELPSESGDWSGLGDEVVSAEALDDTVKPAVTEQVFATGGSIDLTAGWDDLDQVLNDALPSDSSLQGYEGLIEAFNVEGIAPLDPGTLGSEDEWKPLSAEEWGVGDDEPEAVSDGSPAAGNGPADTEEIDEFAILDRLAQDSSFEQDPGAAADAAGGDLGLSEADLALSASWHRLDDDGTSRAGVDGYTAILRSLDSEQPFGEDVEHADRPDENDSGPLPADDQGGLEEAAVGQADEVTAPGGLGDAGILDGEDISHGFLTSSGIIGEIPNSDIVSNGDAYALGESRLETEADADSQSLADSADALDRERATREDRETSPWPRFAAGIGELRGASESGFQLFAQMREEKASLVELGVLTVDRRLAWPEPDAVAQATDEDGGDVGVAPGSEASTPPSLGREHVRALRSRLDGDLSNVEETARELAELVAGAHGAAASRLLGEAYLRLGRPAEAADLFRRAIVQRGHFR